MENYEGTTSTIRKRRWQNMWSTRSSHVKPRILLQVLEGNQKDGDDDDDDGDDGYRLYTICI